MILKSSLKKFEILNKVNAMYKSFILKKQLAKLSTYYNIYSKKHEISYDFDKVIDSVKLGFTSMNPAFLPKTKGKLKIFWIGTSLNQDYSGFIQSLTSFGDIQIFINHLGQYGLWNKFGKAKIYDRAVVGKNDESLQKQIFSTIKIDKPDLVIGQMWAGRISSDILQWVRDQGIPIINISMDDRLPQHWGYIGSTRLGAIGLGKSVDLTLTTTSSCCNWYACEKANAIYFPLAANPDIFFRDAAAERDIEILFIGNKYGIREKLISRIISEGFNIQVYGSGWPNGTADFKLSVELSKRAKIILGIGTVGHCEDLYTLKLRDFEAPMSGALYLTSRNPDLVDLFSEAEEMDFYDTEDELINKLRIYTSDNMKRLDVAKKGQLKAITRDTWDKRLSEVFSQIGIIQ